MPKTRPPYAAESFDSATAVATNGLTPTTASTATLMASSTTSSAGSCNSGRHSKNQRCAADSNSSR